MKRIAAVLIVCLMCFPLRAQQPSDASQRPRVGVVLSGGGAKGAAHIGVLKYMEEMGIPVDCVTGTSMGSIIGGLYALGYSPDEMARLIADMDWSLYMSNNVSREYQSASVRQNAATYLLSVPFGSHNFETRSSSLLSSLPSGVINGASLTNLFNSLSIGYQDSINFDDLPVPFACVATDILTGDSVVLRSGVFAKAIRSSMAIPGVFSPVKWGKHLLADGGLVNNFPVDVCKQMGADIVIGIELADDVVRTPEDLQSLPQQLSQYLAIAVQGNRFRYREMCDVYMHPNITGYNMLSFSSDNIDTLVRRGYESARSHDAELRAIKARLEAYGPCAKQLHAPRARKLNPSDTIVLASVAFKGVKDNERAWLDRKGRLIVGEPTTISDIERAIGVLRGTGAYSAITYGMDETEEEYWLDHGVYTEALGRESYNLSVDLIPAEPHRFALGFRYDSEESSDLLFHFGFNEQRLYGFEGELNVELNYNFRVDTKLAYRGLGLGDINFTYGYHNSNFDLFSFSGNELKLNHKLINHNIFSLHISEFHLLNFTFAAGVNENFYSTHRAFSLDSVLVDGVFHFDESEGALGLFLKGRYENLDAAYFSRSGYNLQFGGEWRKANDHFFAGGKGGFLDVNLDWTTYLSPSRRFTFVPHIAARMVFGEAPDWYQTIAGGAMANRYTDQHLAFIGINKPVAMEDLTAVARLDLRYNVFGKFYLALMANYIISADRFDQFFTGSADYHGCLGTGLRVAYDSPIGPVSVDLHWNNNVDHRMGAYVNVGCLF